MRTKKSDWSQLWKRNMVVAAIALFVCAAVYLNWNYGKDAASADAGKTMGQSAMVGGKTQDPLVGGDSSAATGVPSGDGSGEAQTGAEAQPGEESSGGAYFATARLNRQQARDSALSLLQDAAAREDADEAVKTQLNDNIQTMADYTVTEAQIENLVVAKGYTDCVAFISDGGVSVVVSATENGLQDADVARITEIVTGETGVPASQITIIEAQG